MTPQNFATETGRIINENHNELVSLYLNKGKEDTGALLLMFSNKEMNYCYISETQNKILFDKLEPFMKDKIRNNPDKIYVICLNGEGIVACHFFNK